MSVTQAAIDALFADGAAEQTQDDQPSATQASPTAPSGSGASPSARQPDIERILHISVPVNVTLAERSMSIESILALHVGSIIEFEKPFDSELSLRIGNREIGKGQAVKVGENFGLRVSAIGTVQERIDAMGG